MLAIKTVLVTGCSASGIGCAVALELAKRGHHVFATARNPAKIPEELSVLSNVTTLPLDVTSPPSIADAAKAVELATGQQGAKGLDILVNNAGVGSTMPLLDVDIAEAQKLYDTNVWGPLRVLQAFADLLIAKRGRMVNVSSVGGACITPWIGVYSSSKAALTNLSETLRLELAPFGVTVVTVMVGSVNTAFNANEPPVVLPSASRYTPLKDTIARWATAKQGPSNGCPPEKLAELLLDDIEGGRGGKVWKGPNAGTVKFMTGWIPTWIYDALVSRTVGLSELSKTIAP